MIEMIDYIPSTTTTSSLADRLSVIECLDDTFPRWIQFLKIRRSR